MPTHIFSMSDQMLINKSSNKFPLQSQCPGGQFWETICQMRRFERRESNWKLIFETVAAMNLKNQHCKPR